MERPKRESSEATIVSWGSRPEYPKFPMKYYKNKNLLKIKY
jgi:hypothetical protein